MDVLIAQANRCLYCGNLFDDMVHIPRRGNVHLGLTWDHFVPYAYLVGNPAWNWVAACKVCNGIKSSLMFDSVIDARRHIIGEWIRKGYHPTPVNIDVLSDWLPGITSAPDDLSERQSPDEFDDDEIEGDADETVETEPVTGHEDEVPRHARPVRQVPMRAVQKGRSTRRRADAVLTPLLAAPATRKQLVRMLVASGISTALAGHVIDMRTRPAWGGCPGRWLRVPRAEKTAA